MPWSCAFRSTFRLFRSESSEDDLVDVFLGHDGRTEMEVLGALPYHKARTSVQRRRPSRKRYRDGRQLLRTIGLLYDELVDGNRRLRVTPLGHAVRRWRPVVNQKNVRTLGWHAARALAACQLRNPTAEGRRYPTHVEVFPFAFIWRAMVELDGRITSEELNRSIFHTEDVGDLDSAIEKIREYRQTRDVDDLGPEVVSGPVKNDRVLVWMSWASFGWSLIGDKRQSGGLGYEISERMFPIIREATALSFAHKEFGSEREYVSYVADCGALPVDLR